MKKIIMFSGKAESGKDTLANVAKEYFENKGKSAKIVKFGNFLKIICSEYFCWDGKKDENGRQLLQTVSDGFKKNINSYFFADVLAGLLLTLNPSEEYILIPDVRYLEEIETFKLKIHVPQYIVRVNRPMHKNSLTEEQRNHHSETQLDNYENFDYVVSDGDINSKINQLIKFLEVV